MSDINKKVILKNTKTNKLEKVDQKDVLHNLYFLLSKPIEESEFEGSKDINIIIGTKDNISRIEDNIILYDIYTSKLILVDKYNVYDRVVSDSYRFPDKNFYERLSKSNEKDDKLKVDFLDNFNLDILYSTFVLIFYKYSDFTGQQISFCKKPSFIPIFKHLKPYYKKSELVNMGLNCGLITLSENQNKKDLMHD